LFLAVYVAGTWFHNFTFKLYVDKILGSEQYGDAVNLQM